MGPDGGWRYHDPHHHWGPGAHHPGTHLHGPPPWMDGPDPSWSIVPALLPLLLVLWVVYRWYALDLFAERARALRAARSDTVRPRWDAAVARHAETAQAYAAFECDPAAVLHRPALADVTEAAPGPGFAQQPAEPLAALAVGRGEGVADHAPILIPV